ncbi:transposase [Candidatus Methylomirabilis limnetica]
MARKPRVYFPGALYHVICRGNQGQPIFSDDADRGRYLELLQETRLRYDFRLYAYVLMGNHVHHLIEVGPTSLSAFLHTLLFRDTRDWTQRYRDVGHLFHGRHHAILCEKDSYYSEHTIACLPPLAKGGKGGFERSGKPPQSPFAKGGSCWR